MQFVAYRSFLLEKQNETHMKRFENVIGFKRDKIKRVFISFGETRLSSPDPQVYAETGLEALGR